jgi:1-phosphofructokinase
VEDGYAVGTSEADVIGALERLHDLGAQDVVVSRAEEPALALVDDKGLDHHGAGDSQTAAMAYGLATRRSSEDLLRLGVAAGALNVTRRGLGSGTKADIEQLAGTVEVRSRDQISADPGA